MYSFLRWSFVKSYWRLCFKMVMLQLAPLPSPAGASTALWAWKVSAERLTFSGWTVSFISVTVWLITALSQFFLSYVWFNMFKTMMRSADIFFFFRCRELEGIQWKFQKPVQGSIQSIQIVRLHTKTVMKATEEEGKEVWCRGSLALMTSKDTAEATVSMRLEEASNVSCNVFLMFELATFIAYFILLDSLFFTITLSRECGIYWYSFSSYWLQYLYGQ